ncbi:MAG: hypothetical protein JWN02_2024, partial [Acidobacteria bacterium]|nr:hypothetical protein [Acidobacteriota bacterium]
MKNTKKAAINVVAAGTTALLLATSAFAQPAPRNDGYRGQQPSYEQQQNGNGQNRNGNRQYRENERVNVNGRVSAFNRERDGYRVQLDRGGSYWIPSSRIRNVRDLRVGINIGLGGIFRGGDVYVDAVSWPGGAVVEQGSLRGSVDRVDYRSGTVWVRDAGNGRVVSVDMRGNGRNGRVDMRDLRRGDFITVSG